ncbi:PQQ-binding-like beta-propeller repeat protein [Pedosphaera parvula]|uniref:Pyrrolo-quinoline quinone n=1 Tax=Pedosphaera parvula (strain Ellin514) TaxID=320771 RepID=B9XCC7_PEDPL|nr:PQQ-binding-like beta-propeller repeat protein [Pedosphaera parvula]EEF62595.1 Pyrrolo-quinoline quinone [Pedosphaera parvula Ellin514]
MKLLPALVLIPLLARSLYATGDTSANWPHWRGSRDNGSVETGTYPVKWNAETNLSWKLELPGKGCSTPIVWQNHIFVTAPVDGQDSILAVDWSGKLLWTTRFGAERSGKNAHGSGSNPSPVTDGKSIFVYYKSGEFAALDFDGKVLWQTNLVELYGRDTLYWDYGTSPVLTGRDVVIARLHHGESYLAAFDKSTGALHWKVARNYITPDEGDHSYATPILMKHESRETLLVLGGEHLTAHDADDGKVLWSCGDFNPQGKRNWVPVASPVIAGDMVIVPYGRGTRLHGIKLGGTADVTITNRIWMREDTGSFCSTPAEYKGRVYLLHDHGPDRGVIECIDPTTGKTLLRDELPRTSSEFYASPTVADGKIYAVREDGVVFVARIEPKFDLLAENDMGEQIIASPVLVANHLLLRGEKHLFCIGNKR